MSDPVTKAQWAEARRHSIDAVLERLEKRTALLSYQQRTVALLESSGCQVLFVEQSQRIGLTWGFASYAVLRPARAREAGGMDVMHISYSQEMTREFIDACAMWARAFNQLAGELEEFVFEDEDDDGKRAIQAFRIKFASGFEIVGLSSASRSLRGKQGVVMIDEAAFVDNLKELLKAALTFLMWGGQVVVCSTHNGVDNHFNEQIQDILSGRKPYQQIRIDFDDALKDGLNERICLVTGKECPPEGEAEWRENIIKFYVDGADEELFCVPTMGSGTWLAAPLIEARMILGGAPMLVGAAFDATGMGWTVAEDMGCIYGLHEPDRPGGLVQRRAPARGARRDNADRGWRRRRSVQRDRPAYVCVRGRQRPCRSRDRSGRAGFRHSCRHERAQHGLPPERRLQGCASGNAFRRARQRRRTLGSGYLFPLGLSSKTRCKDFSVRRNREQLASAFGQRVLDFGCGHGDEARMLRKVGIGVTTFEPYRSFGKLPSRAAGRYSASGLLRAVESGTKFNSVLLSSVLNSVPFDADRRHIVTICAALAGPETVLFAAARSRGDPNWTETSNGIGLGKTAARSARFVLLDEPGMSLSELNANPKVQRYFQPSEFRNLFQEAFEDVSIGLHINNVTATCRRPRPIDLDRLREALAFEFDLPCPEGRMGFVEKACRAFSARLGVRYERLGLRRIRP